MKANARPGAHSEAPGWSSGGGASPAPRTRKPGRSAHEWSTQGIFPWHLTEAEALYSQFCWLFPFFKDLRSNLLAYPRREAGLDHSTSCHRVLRRLWEFNQPLRLRMSIQALQVPRPDTEPRNPEPPKVHLKLRKMPKKWPEKSQLKCPKKIHLWGELKCPPKMDILDILIDLFRAIFSGGATHFRCAIPSPYFC